MGEDSKNGAETGQNSPPEGKRFTSEEQPTSEQKKAGWDRKKRGQELVRLILSTPFKGGDGELRGKIAAYFGIDENDVSIEEMILYKQAEKAINNSDTRSAQFLWEVAYGKPMQPTDINHSIQKPVIIDWSYDGAGTNNEVNPTLRRLVMIPANKAKD